MSCSGVGITESAELNELSSLLSVNAADTLAFGTESTAQFHAVAEEGYHVTVILKEQSARSLFFRIPASYVGSTDFIGVRGTVVIDGISVVTGATPTCLI